MHTVTGKSIFISELFLTLFVVSIETVKLDFFYTRKFVLLCPYSVKEACNVIYPILVQSSAISAARYWDFTFKRYLLYLINLIIYINLVTLDQLLYRLAIFLSFSYWAHFSISLFIKRICKLTNSICVLMFHKSSSLVSSVFIGTNFHRFCKMYNF